MKLWDKASNKSTFNDDAERFAERYTERLVERFTVGRDREFDLFLAEHDALGSLAHGAMLHSIGLLTAEEWSAIEKALREIWQQARFGTFVIEEDVEDVHSQIELNLTRTIGEAGKKIHSGRSRNDQVAVDCKLFFRAELHTIVEQTNEFFELLLNLAETHKNTLLPGYTHFQIAMPSSFGLWFSAYAESLTDDMQMLLAAYRITNKNPLGSAAGYGSSFPLDRRMTTRALGFEDLNYNVMYAQMGRGKTERVVAQALASIAATLAKLAMDVTLFMNQNFGFVSFSHDFTTGSSIMPHKKNPDIFELVRARCNRLLALPNEITLLTANLPSGYHRDVQLLKEILFPAFQNLRDCLEIVIVAFGEIQVHADILSGEGKSALYAPMFSVEEVNKHVLSGMPFRDAYRRVAADIESGEFIARQNDDERDMFSTSSALAHTHEGSMGNLCLDEIRRMMKGTIEQFSFETANTAIRKLIGENDMVVADATDMEE
jgi:argininosuccinate lyase